MGRLARELPAGVRDPGFEALLSRIDQGPIHPGNRVSVHCRGEAIFSSMLAAIRDARREVLVEAYIFRDDATGRAFLEALGAAAERGVAVRVVADAFGSLRTRPAFWREMEERGVEVRLFHPLFTRPWYQPFRDHRKILVVDRRTAFTGGMNIGEEYVSPAGSADGTWRDTAVRLDGSAAWEMAVVFGEAWNRAGGTELSLEPVEVEAGAGPGRVRALVLDSRPGRGHAESASVLAAIVAAATRRVCITSGYFAPGPLAVRVLEHAVRRGVDVRLLLPAKTDVPLARHAGHGFYAGLLGAGVRLWEYKAAILHAKTLTADGYVSVVGSSNIDIRSFRFNGECNLVMLDEEVAGELETAFRDDLARSREIRPGEWVRRGAVHRLGDALARCLTPVL